MKKHWYKIHIGACPVCGKDQSYRIRVYGKKPKEYKDRIVHLSYTETYDQCIEREF